MIRHDSDRRTNPEPDWSDFAATLRQDLGTWCQAHYRHSLAVGSEAAAQWLGRALCAAALGITALLVLACLHVALAVALGGWAGWLVVAGALLLEAAGFLLVWKAVLRDRFHLFVLNRLHSHASSL